MTISVLLSTATGSNSKEPSTEQRSAAEILLSVSPVMMRTRISTKSQFPTPTRLKFTCYSLASLANIATNELMRSDSSKSKVTLTTTKRIGSYSPKERQELLEKFHAKRSKRIWKKNVRYGCRKNLADQRIRIKGRFVKT